LIQSAALVGFVGITFLLGAVAAGIALSLRTRNPAPVLIAAGLFAANAAYGYWQVSRVPAASLRVALIDSNAYGYWVPSMHEHQPAAAVEAAALRVIDAYAGQIESLRVATVAFPLTSSGGVTRTDTPDKIEMLHSAAHSAMSGEEEAHVS
jgi:apolipoprotein N-acyltransferase